MTLTKKVLIIDDDGIFIFTASRSLRKTELVSDVWSSIHGKDALSFLNKRIGRPEELPDLILLDIEIPIMDAWEFLTAYQEIRHTLGKDIVIFLTTASISSVYLEKSKEFSHLISGYMVKPIHDADFMTMLTYPASKAFKE